MTGSGKTGLGIVLLEEALAQGRAGADPRPEGRHGQPRPHLPRPLGGELPALDRRVGRPRRRPDARRVRRRRRPSSGSAASPARASTPSGSRRSATRPSVTLYTPGSEAGVPLNVIGSLQAPTLSWETDEETIRDEIEGTVSSLLGLVGIEADPLGSREHVLLSNLLEHNWRAGHRPRPRHADRADPAAAAAQARRLRDRRVPAPDGAERARRPAERARRVAVVRRLGPRARRSTPPCCSAPRTAGRAPP